MKQIIAIEIVRPSSAPTVFVEEPAEIPEGTAVRVEVTDGQWEGAVYIGKVLRTQK